jgi:MFS family permease
VEPRPLGLGDLGPHPAVVGVLELRRPTGGDVESRPLVERELEPGRAGRGMGLAAPSCGTGGGGAASRLRGLCSAAAPELPAPVWALQGGMLLNAVGTGFVFPFLVVYLHGVRGLSLGASGVVAAAFGAATFAATPFGGAVADRFGARRTLIGSLALLAAGYALVPTSPSAAALVACMAVAGLGNAGFYPSQSALTLAFTPPECRPAAFSLQRVGQNVGVAVGGIAGGLIAQPARPWTFTVLFFANAISFALYAAVVPFLPRVAAERRSAIGGSFRAVVRDRVFVRLIALNVVVAGAGYASFETLLAPYARDTTGIGERAIALVFFANMLAVAAFQLPVTRLVAGRARARVLAGAAAVFAISYAVVPAIGAAASGAAAAALLVAVSGLYSVGEMLHGPTQSALVADLAPPELRGRYFSLLTCSYALGFTLGPAAGGALMGASGTGFWAVAVVILLAGAVGLVRLDARLPARGQARSTAAAGRTLPRRPAATAVARQSPAPAQ